MVNWGGLGLLIYCLAVIAWDATWWVSGLWSMGKDLLESGA